MEGECILKYLFYFIKKSTTVLCLLIIFVIVLSNTSEAAVNNDDSKLKMSFAVISDIHDDTIKLDDALRDLNNIDPNYRAVVLNGDIVNQGLQSQYDDISNLLKRDKDILPENVIKNIGNHEYYDYVHGAKGNCKAKCLLNRFLNFANRSNPYFDSWINGYHFISLGSEKTYTPEMDNNVQAFLSDTQLDWLKQELANKYIKGKPIFVFLHQTLDNSVIGSTVFPNAIKQDRLLRAILSKYPEAVFFTSHTHHYLNVPGNFVKQNFAIIDSSSVHRPIRYDQNNNEIDVAGKSQGVFVKVYNDKVVLKGREFSNNTWIDGANYVISLNFLRK